MQYQLTVHCCEYLKLIIQTKQDQLNGESFRKINFMQTHLLVINLATGFGKSFGECQIFQLVSLTKFNYNTCSNYVWISYIKINLFH